MSDVGRRVDQLSPEKRALLERQLLARRAAQQAGTGPVRGLQPRGPGVPPALSFAQQQLWFLDQWQPGGSAYNASLDVRFDGPLDEDALLAAFQAIVERHETLRTVVVDDDGVPVARLLDEPRVTFTHVDLRPSATGCEPGPDGEADEAAVVAAVRSVVDAPFDLARDLMLRVGLIRLGPESRIVCVVMHHIACDGWSRSIVFDELAELYAANVEHRRAELPALPVQYADYAHWQQGWLRGPVLQAEREFWREELAGVEEVLALPTDFPRPEVLSFRGARRSFEIPEEPARRLRELGREQRATIFMVMHAATGVLLHAVTGQVDFCVGSPVANRRWPETEGLIGFFVNTLLLRLRMRGDPSFAELVGRSRETAVNCYAHQELPFEQVVQAVRPKRRGDRNPLFQVNLRMQGPAPDPPRLPGLTSRRVSVGVGSSRFDLALGFVDQAGPMPGYIEYNSALFDPATVAGWSDGFAAIVGAAVVDPELRISELARIGRDRFTAR